MKRVWSRKRFWTAVGASATVTALATWLIVDIQKKKIESLHPYPHLARITDETDDPAIWGQNFPHHYSMYLKTVDQVRTKYGGSEALPHIPTAKDPRRQVSQSRLDEDPRLKTMWAGYAFAHDFREERGHAFMFLDQLYTQRQDVTKQPGTCLNCHASTYVYMKQLGDGDLEKGFGKMNSLPYAEASKNVHHPVSCIDCHTPQTMKLRITRPAFMEGIRAVKQASGLANYDVNHDASPQEMRTYTCAQCHVEYYFKGPEKRLTFPWTKGLKADQIFSYYEDVKHKDWTHKVTGADVLKAQHPEFEMYSQGIHARSGVSCVDCHMPYQRVGAMKVTDHHVRSPVLNIRHACMTCHRWSEAELKYRVETIQDRTFEIRGVALDALTEFIGNLENAKAKHEGTPKFAEAQRLQRRAQFLLDFVEAENSMGFHAPEEALRVLGLSLDSTRRGQVLLRDLGNAKK
ncbi:MAG: ammonia-forming cytochrome c nitrite reductase subunit c552 [Bdellovibrionales bacterium]